MRNVTVGGWVVKAVLLLATARLCTICVPCPRSYCSLCHVNLYVLLLLLLHNFIIKHEHPDDYDDNDLDVCAVEEVTGETGEEFANSAV